MAETLAQIAPHGAGEGLRDQRVAALGRVGVDGEQEAALWALAEGRVEVDVGRAGPAAGLAAIATTNVDDALAWLFCERFTKRNRRIFRSSCNCCEPRLWAFGRHTNRFDRKR